VEKNIAVGVGGVLAADIRSALGNRPAEIHTVVAGLGGRAITASSIHRVLDAARLGTLPPLHFLDLDRRVVETELRRPRWTSTGT
jgi:pyruvate ferredoxin oxidoreductase alpha subunit